MYFIYDRHRPQASNIQAAVHMLTEDMGKRFKVLAVSSRGSLPPPIFER